MRLPVELEKDNREGEVMWKLNGSVNHILYTIFLKKGVVYDEFTEITPTYKQNL